MSNISFAEKYNDAFWRVVPIPVLLGADLVAVLRDPSGVAVTALVLIGVVGLLVELSIWRDLRTRWTAGASDESVEGSAEDSWRPAKLALIGLMLVGAWTLKAHDTEGMSWGDAAVFSLVLLPIYVALLAVVVAIVHLFGGDG